MIKKFMQSLLCLFLFSLCGTLIQSRVKIDKNTEREIERILKVQDLESKDVDIGLIVKDISEAFLNMPYEYNTLISSPQVPEVLVVKFYGLDCFTMIDYVLALSKSHSKDEFIKKLTEIRYIDNKIDYSRRKHFFTDWCATSPRNAIDVTERISPHSVLINKSLNLKSDGSYFLPGVSVKSRAIRYIPSRYVDSEALKKLKEGDFVGIYSNLDGLDVSHVGIIVKKNGQTYYRNASSLKKNMKVVDEKLIDYIANKPGIVVLRAE